MWLPGTHSRCSTSTQAAGRIDSQRQNIEFSDIALFSDINCVREFTTGYWKAGGFTEGWWKPGIHRAPWKPRFLSNGVALVTISQSGQLWGMHEAPAVTPQLLDEVRKTMAAAATEESGGLIPDIADYRELHEISRDEYDELLRIKERYEKDRAEYGRLIGLGVERDGQSAG